MTHAPSTLDALPPTEPSGRPRLWTRGFVLLCLVTALCYFSNYLINVTLPLFVEELGGSPVVAGLIFTSFSVASFILRPLAGHLIDTWSVRGTLVLGSGLLGTFGAAFLVPSIWVACVANAVRGVGWGATNTAGSSAVALTSPPSRRGEASGHYSLASTVAVSFAPALGLWLLSATGSFSVVFAAATGAGLLAVALAAAMPPIGSRTTSFLGALSLPRGGLSFGSFVDRPVLLASLLLVCITLTQPITFAFVPVHAKNVGVDNIGLYFIASGATSILARFVLGPLLDRGSRGLWIVVGYGMMMAAFVAFILANRIELFIVAAVFTGVGHSVAQPSLMALAMDRADRSRMGKAMATYSMFYRVGEGVGAPVAGALIVAFGFSGMYLGGIAYSVAGVLLALLNWRTVGKPVGARAGA